MIFDWGVVWYIQVLPSTQCSFFPDSDISDPFPSVGHVWSDIITIRGVAEHRGKFQQVLHLHPHYVLFIVRTLRQCTSSNIIWSGWVGGGECRRSRSPGIFVRLVSAA
jgi:hypothetical protein